MPAKSNTLKANTRKKSSVKKTTKATAAKPKSKKTKSSGSKNVDPRVVRIIGFFFLLTSVYLFLAFISFFMNWFDASNISESFRDHSEDVQNWTGSLGVNLSYYFVQRGVGIGALFFPTLFLGIGLRMLMKVRMFKLWTWFQVIVISLLWLPMVFSMIFPVDPWNILAGEAGKQLNVWMHPYVGN